MAHLLTDCEDLLKAAWKEVKVQRSHSSKNQIKALVCEIGHDMGENFEDTPEYIALNDILQRKADPYAPPFTIWKSCQQYYRAMLLLLNSDYESCTALDIGNAETYFRQAIPLYCQLSGETPPVLKRAETEAAS